ncbi:hypothetical protein [Cellulomonas sp. ES6]|uniref:hypothetical protein n=1 Tax=Cellulomonas sp. ES6 TaxID=3039384 RepID=UPI0024B79377|nr:hypothetical protein [Cellulomonas sp. ES6]WHP17782.1 hypothetical protein P9841_01015 [Cellulomonas sp. ES6]
MATRKTWAAGAGVLSAGLMAGTWFLGVSPALSDASDTRIQTESVEAQNAGLQAKLDALVADAPNLSQYEAQLETLRAGIPTDADLTEYLRRIDEVAAARGVTVTSVTPGVPTGVVPSQSQLDGSAAPADGAAPTDGATATPAPSATPGTEQDEAQSQALAQAMAELASQLDGFQAVPISLTVMGSFPATTGFVGDLQSADGRLLLVTDVTVTGQPEQAASDGRPATQEGDAEVVLSGYLFVLDDPRPDDGADDDGTSPPSVEPQDSSPLSGGTAGA